MHTVLENTCMIMLNVLSLLSLATLDWNNYRKVRNQVNYKLGQAYTAYQSRLFDSTFTGSCRQF